MSAAFTRFIGVFDADGGVWGELRYLVGKVTGSSACALCDVTHGLNPRGKAAWRACTSSFPVPLTTVHRNEQGPALAAVTAGSPAVRGGRAERRHAGSGDRSGPVGDVRG